VVTKVNEMSNKWWGCFLGLTKVRMNVNIRISVDAVNADIGLIVKSSTREIL